MREAGEDLLAIYHSHPASPAAPSTIDIAEAGYPEAIYLIISLNTKGVLEMRGFRIQGEAVGEVVLEIEA
jgi:proteasome lid subunit RPN8/RPN11